MFFKERAVASERYYEKCATASEKKICAAASERHFLFLSKCVAACENVSIFLRNVWLFLTIYLRKNVRLLLKENVQLLL